jgi:hypothetical protein
MALGNGKHSHSKHIASDNVYLEIELHWLKYEYTYTSSKEKITEILSPRLQTTYSL